MTLSVFVISMPNSPRRKKIIQDFTKYGINFEFFDAVVGRDLTAQQKQQLYDDTKAKQVEFSLTDPEIGCALSHKYIYQKMIHENIPSALIFEDDVQINENLPLFLNIYKNLIPKNAHIVLLGGLCRKFLRTQKLFSRWMLSDTPFIMGGKHAKLGKSYALSGGAHAYFITLPGAEIMYKLQSPKVCWAADAITGDMIFGNHNLYAIIPPIFNTQNIASTICDDYTVDRTANKPSFNKFIRMCMIESSWFKRFMLYLKMNKLRS